MIGERIKQELWTVSTPLFLAWFLYAQVKAAKQKKTLQRHMQRLLTEIEMLKVVLYLVCRNNRRSEAG